MKISLIVPFYNEERYLSCSIRSIQQQTFSDYEVLLIDDFSTDGSYVLAKEMIQGDMRFHLMHNVEKGLYNARNKALSIARGEYICFLDADDELLPDYLSDLYTESQKEDIDLVVQGFTRINQEHKDLVSVATPGFYDLSKEAQEAFSSFDVANIGNVFGKLYRRKHILDHNLTFSPRVFQCEDLYFVVSYLAISHKIVLSTVNNYNYIAHENSMSTQYREYEIEKHSFQDLLNVWKVLLATYSCSSLHASFGSFYGPYLHRLLFSSLTYPSSQEKRGSNISEIESTFFGCYDQVYHPWTMFTRLLKWTIIHRLYWLFLLLNRIAVIRYGIKVRYI